MHATELNAATGMLGALRDTEATGDAIRALRALCAGDLAALLVAMFEVDRRVCDDVTHAGVRSALLEFAGEVRELPSVAAYLDGVANGDGYGRGDLHAMADAMEDACDGCEAVAATDVRAWAGRLSEVADALAEHASAVRDVIESEFGQSVTG